MNDNNNSTNIKIKNFLLFDNIKRLSSIKNKKDKYKKIKTIGEGSSGIVYLIYSVNTKIRYVLKKIDLKDHSNTEIKEIYNEVNILKKFDHPNIIKFIEVNKSQRFLEIVTEYAEIGDLYAQICSQKDKNIHFPEKTIIYWLIQICQALKYIHSKHVIHRDIKPHNIFLTKNGSIKLGDFGVSKNLNNTNMKAKTFVGTTYYLPPEIIFGEPYSYKADIWSLGVTFYQLMTFKVPYDGHSFPSIINKITDGGYEKINQDDYSEDLINLVYKMMDSDPNNRPKASDILNMEFIKNRIKIYLKENKYDDMLSKTFIKRYQESISFNNSDLNKSNNNNNITNSENNIVEFVSFKNKLKFNNIIELNKEINNNIKKNNKKIKFNKNKTPSEIITNNNSNDNINNKNNKNKNIKYKIKDKDNISKCTSIGIPKIKITNKNPPKTSKSMNENQHLIISQNSSNNTIDKKGEINFDNTIKTNMASYNQDGTNLKFDNSFIEKNIIQYENGEKEINLDNHKNEEFLIETQKEIEMIQNLKEEYDHHRNMNLLNSFIIGKSDKEVENENKLLNSNESDIEENNEDYKNIVD